MALLLSTHKICFKEKKNQYFLVEKDLSGAMSTLETPKLNIDRQYFKIVFLFFSKKKKKRLVI